MAGEERIKKNIHFMGNRDLKGIWGVDLYPVFWYEELPIEYDYYEKNNPDFFTYETHSESIVEKILNDIETNEQWKLPASQINRFKELPVKDYHNYRKTAGRENARYKIELHIAPVIFNTNTEKFLIAKRSNEKSILPGKWEFGGGQIVYPERITDGAVRKARDEFNIDVKPVEEILTLYYINDFRINGIKMLCLTTKDEVQINLTQHQEYRWVALLEMKELNPDDCIDRMYEDAKNFYSKYKKSIS